MNHVYKPSLLLSILLGFSSNRYWKWLDVFGSAEAVLATPASELTQLDDETRKQLYHYQNRDKNGQLIQQAERVMDQLDRRDAVIIDYNSRCYPPLLKQIHRPPPLLFIKGNADVLSMPQIAIVGSRHATKNGLENSYHFSASLAQHGFSITSGLAIGIDGAAHRGALAVSGKSIGVMATGVDNIYPRQHRVLADDILNKEGVLVTEFFPGSGVRPKHFPQRNRIISGLCSGVLVVEAALKSGSLITARYALEQDREVFAVPGSIDNPQSRGTHALIKQGAHLVETAGDIVEQLSSFLHTYLQNTCVQNQPAPNIDQCSKEGNQVFFMENDEPSTKQREPCSPQESLLLEHMDFEFADVDQLTSRTGLSAADISALLISLELKGYIELSELGYTKKAYK